MNHVVSEGNCQPCALLPYMPFYQQSGHDQCFGLFQGGPNRFLRVGTHNSLSIATTTKHTPQHEASSLQYYSEVLHCLQPRCMPQMPGDPVIPQGSQMSFMQTASEQAPQRPLGYRWQKSDDNQKKGTAGDLTACQLRNPSSSLPQGVVGASAHSSHKPTEDALQKRELRLMKNREAARECRRKKKEYVKCLENRVAVLENQNKTLIEELRALKDVYRHKVE